MTGERPARRTPPRGRRCPICREPTDAAYRPFCSKRCADLDLGRWMKGAYAVPSEELDAPDAEDGLGAAEAFGSDPIAPRKP